MALSPSLSLSLFAGTSKGFRIYHSDPFSKIFSSDDGSVSIIEMLFSTSLVALVLSPRHLVIQNTKVRNEERPPKVYLLLLVATGPNCHSSKNEGIGHLRTHLSLGRPRRPPE